MNSMKFFRRSASSSPSGTAPHGQIGWIIAGLGNPGLTYENTRHNTGFMAIETLAERHDGDFKKMQFQADCGDVMIGQTRCLLMKPATFMNRSGDAIGKAADFYKISAAHVLVLYDDIALPPGKIRVRPKGSAGGHNGMKSIIAQLGTEEFPRVRIGIGAKPDPRYDLADWVLSKYTEEDLQTLRPALEHAAEAAEYIVQGDLNRAMNQYNA